MNLNKLLKKKQSLFCKLVDNEHVFKMKLSNQIIKYFLVSLVLESVAFSVQERTSKP